MQRGIPLVVVALACGVFACDGSASLNEVGPSASSGTPASVDAGKESAVDASAKNWPADSAKADIFAAVPDAARALAEVPSPDAPYAPDSPSFGVDAEDPGSDSRASACGNAYQIPCGNYQSLLPITGKESRDDAIPRFRDAGLYCVPGVRMSFVYVMVSYVDATQKMGVSTIFALPWCLPCDSPASNLLVKTVAGSTIECKHKVACAEFGLSLNEMKPECCVYLNDLPSKISSETCDGVDNDCDSQIDEDGANDACRAKGERWTCQINESGFYGAKCVCTSDCAGKVCGASDGCGGKCNQGTCPTRGDTCVYGVCKCVAVCGYGAKCGDDDGCGGKCGGACSTEKEQCAHITLESGKDGYVCTTSAACMDSSKCSKFVCGEKDGCGGVCLEGSGCKAPCAKPCSQLPCDTYDCNGRYCSAGSGCAVQCVTKCPLNSCGQDDGCGGKCTGGCEISNQCTDVTKCLSMKFSRDVSNWLVATATNTCDQAVECAFYPNDGTSSQSDTFGAGQTKDQISGGLWWPDATSVSYTCKLPSESQLCFPD